MTRTLAFAFAVTTLVAAALSFAPDPGPADVPVAFWQVHGAAPQAGETDAERTLRLAQRTAVRERILVAAR
jgi:hypothetical protein